MDLSPIRLDFDLGPEEAGRSGAAVVRLPMLRQGADNDFEISWLIDGAPFDFTLYGAVMTVRSTAQATSLFSLSSAAGEIVLASGSIRLIFAASKTSGLAVPASLPRVAGPQYARWGHEIRLKRGAEVWPCAAGALCMQYDFTRS